MLGLLDADLPLDVPVSQLPIAQKQLVEIAKVLARDSRIIIMDEPTSTLTDREKTALFRVIGTLKRRGVAILYVTHHLREVEIVGDHVSAMVDGRITQSCPVTPDLTESRLITMLTGREVRAFSRRSRQSSESPLLGVGNLKTRTGCRDVSLSVGRGEIVGVYGVVGCGRESLGRVLVGVEPQADGEVILDGRPYRPRHPAHARRLGVSYLSMDLPREGSSWRARTDSAEKPGYLMDLRRGSQRWSAFLSWGGTEPTLIGRSDGWFGYGSRGYGDHHPERGQSADRFPCCRQGDYVRIMP